jgi:hypothetical protein
MLNKVPPKLIKPVGMIITLMVITLILFVVPNPLF